MIIACTFLHFYSLDHYCLKKGIDLPGGVIKNIAFTTVQACKEDCAKTVAVGCVAFTTLAGTHNRCYLKNKGHAAESANVIAISARMSCYKGKGINKLVLYLNQLIKICKNQKL